MAGGRHLAISTDASEEHLLSKSWKDIEITVKPLVEHQGF